MNDARGVCLSKRRFDTKDEALTESESRGVYAKVTPLRAYRCPECGFWHLTKSGARPAS